VFIGPAGERLLPLATAVHNFPCSSHSGRGGIGAVMGSKNLKAVAVRGTLAPFDVANPKAFEDYSRKAVKALEAWSHFEAWRRWGTAALAEAGNDAAILAVRNFREGSFPKIHRIGAVRAEATFWTRSEACYYCPLHCRKVALLHGKGEATGAVAGPELETSVMLGANCGVEDLAGVLAVKKQCDVLGLDPSSTGNLLAFLMEAADKRLVMPSDLGNSGLAWGNAKAMAAVAEAIAKGEGKVAQFGKGVRAAARLIGGGSEAWAMEVKGLEMDTYNVPALHAMAIVYGTSSVGAMHEMGHSVDVQNQRALSDSLGLCRFHTYALTPEWQASLLAAVTGVNRTAAELLAAGERVWNLERAFSAREGFGAEDDRLPRRPKTEPFASGPKAGAVLTEADETKMLREYYGARGWDPRTAAPLPATLQRLELADVAAASKPG
jgi:aldehyde:ferredoxin oxidoreductase